MSAHFASRGWLFCLTVLFCLASACASKEMPKDPFFEKWKLMAEQSQGHSPTAVPRAQAAAPEHADRDVILGDGLNRVDRQLPTQRVSLKMHKAVVTTVIQALARAAGQSVLINSDIIGEVNINVDNVPWDQVFDGILKSQGLTYAWEGGIIRVMTMKDLENDLKMGDMREKRRAQELVPSVVKINYAKAKNLKDTLEKFLTKDKDGKALGSIAVDENTNALIIQTTREDMRRIVKLVDALDRPRSQVQLKAHIVETTKSTARDLGIQWGGVFKGNSWGNQNMYAVPGGSRTTPGEPQAGGYTANLGKGVSGQGFGIDALAPSPSGTAGAALGLLFGTIGGNILEVQLSALQSQGRLNILSSPSITTLDNQTAYTENGERVPYVTSSNTGGTITREVKFEDVTLRLEITPHIIDKEFLNLEILVKKDEVDLSRSVEGNPFIIKKQTKTNLITKNGETVVISGLTKQKLSFGDQGIPGAKNIPLFGWLFKGESTSNSMEEVLIFITPSVLPEWQTGEAQKSEQEVEAAVKDASVKDTKDKKEVTAP